MASSRAFDQAPPSRLPGHKSAIDRPRGGSLGLSNYRAISWLSVPSPSNNPASPYRRLAVTLGSQVPHKPGFSVGCAHSPRRFMPSCIRAAAFPAANSDRSECLKQRGWGLQPGRASRLCPARCRLPVYDPGFPVRREWTISACWSLPRWQYRIFQETSGG